MDIVAGEKERGSLETLLTTAATRAEIVAAKQLAILSVALFITLTQVVNLLLYVTFRLIELPQNFVIDAPPRTVLTLLLLFVPVAAFIASVLLMISAYAKSYKEAQMYFMPVYLLSLVPSLASTLPGISLRSAIVVVPLANVSVAVREILVGKFDWPMIGVAFVAMSVAAAAMVRNSAKMLSKERLIVSGESDLALLEKGPDLFPRHVWRLYALMLVVIFVVAANVPQLQSFRRQVLFNVVLVMLGGSLLMIRAYGLSFRRALALRPVKPVVWLATLILIPSAHLVAIAFFRMADLVLPVPRQVLEQFSRQLLPETLPLWQLVLFISILPGICEEAAFRGVMLHGLRKKFRPAVLAIVVGIVFGFYHISLFRILPTAVLGIILSALALLTGSIFPCILLHAGNNALALLAERQGFPLASLEWWVYAGAAIVFALGFYLIYRNRTPYPDLRS
jgi:sodium transport system permease protein